ncbi:hypothetical protein [Lentzea kentuckyensis]|uniref:hypothetical protein n=1 Tax=Lentzea kentuckyensis TaxID=360086 RepID=UPI000A3AEB90|nr:hypothetical protein [Lentzea kentuckyensis]
MPFPQKFKMAVHWNYLPVPTGTPMGGYGWNVDRRSDGNIANDLKVRCAIITSPQGGRVVFMQVDVISIPKPVYDDILGRLIDLGVVDSARNFVLSQSHTHAGPMVGAKPDPYVLLGSDRAPSVTQAYTRDHFIPFVVRIAQEAHAKALVDVTLGYAEGFAEIGYNRRGLAWAPRDVPVLVARRADNYDLFAVLAGHACHPVCSPHGHTSLDADYCGYAMDEVEKRLGATKVLVMFFQGAAGDINPMGPDQGGPPQGPEMTRFAAERLVSAIVATVRNAAYNPLYGPITTSIQNVPLPYAVDFGNATEVQELRTKYEARKDEPDGDEAGTGRRHARRMLAELDAGNRPGSLPMTIQKIDLGGLTILTMSHEVLSGWHVGTKNKWAANGRTTPLWVMAYANHIDGYVPAFDLLSKGGADETGWEGDPEVPAPGKFAHSYSLIAPLKAGDSHTDQNGVEGRLVTAINGLLGLQ